MGKYPTNRIHYNNTYKVQRKIVPEIKFYTLQVYEGVAVILQMSLTLAVDKKKSSA